MAAGDLLAAALDYAAKGWPVFPCHPVTKAPLVAGDKDADGKPIPKTGGVKKASTDARQIRDWWTRWPNALIGCATGVAFNVIDFDPRTDDATGEVFTLDRLKAEVEAQIGVALPKTLHSITQSGGVHLFFALPDDGGAPINNRGNLPLHVDVRGLGGYVIVPPSVMESGRLYKWRGSPTTPIAPMPAELVAVLRAPGKGAASEGDSPSPRRAARVSPSPARGEGSAGIDAADEAVRKYGLAAADAEIRNLAGTGDGGRNNALNAAAFALGSLVGAGALSESLARSMLRDVAAQWPNLAKSEGTIESGLTSGMASPRDLSEVRAKAADRARNSAHGHYGKPRNRPEEPPPHPHEGAGRRESSQMGGSAPTPPAGKAARNHDREGSFLPLTDLGNAERWEGRHGGSFRYCDELGWLAWDGKRWSKDDAERLLQESVFATVRGIGDEADWIRQAGEDWRAAGENGEDPDPWVSQPKSGNWKRRSDVHRAWGRASEANRAIAAVSTLGRTMVTTRLDRFDADVWKLNVNNGTLVFVRGDGQPDGYGVPPSVHLKPHDPDDLITMLAPVDYVPGAAAPIYDAFMAKVQPDATVRRFLHAWGGYCLTGDATEQKFVINHGATGANGKSTWIDAIAALMGDYAIAVNIATFMDEKARSGSSPSPDLAELPHKRLVRTSEPPRGVPFAEALVKLVTGGEPLPARQLNKPFFRYLPEFKITVSMNPVPQLSDDAAIWRRTRVVPWNVSIPEGERDHGLPLKLKAEASGILCRLIDGLLDWCAGGLPDTEAVSAATRQIRETVDPLGRFLSTACTLDAASKVNSTRLFKVYEAWATWAGEKPWSQNGFSRALANKGFEKHQSSVIYFLGLGLKLGEEDFLDEQGRPWVNVGRGDGLGGDNVARGDG
jgi:putative DNA primase/helicase